jgi:hypothetical protein
MSQKTTAKLLFVISVLSGAAMIICLIASLFGAFSLTTTLIFTVIFFTSMLTFNGEVQSIPGALFFNMTWNRINAWA